MMIDTPSTKRKKQPIVTRQRKQLVLDFIHEYRRIHEISPKFLDIAKGIGYAENAEGTAFTLVDELVQEGWLRRVAPGMSRAILPVYPVDQIYCEVTDPDLKAIQRRIRNLRTLRRL